MPDFLIIILGALLVGAAIALIALLPRFLFGSPSANVQWVAPPPVVWATAAANDNLPPLTTDQLLVLDSMSGELGYTADEIAVMTGISPANVNLARRHLRAIGLASYGPLYDQDGAGVRGSGYVLTKEGVDAQAEHRRQLQAVAA